MERRLRPVAPKPLPPPLTMPMGATASSVLWGARKRGREDHLLLPTAMSKREREATPSFYLNPPPPPPPVFPAGVGARRYMLHMPKGLLAGCEERLRRLSLVAGSPAAPCASPWQPDATTRRVVPVERDLISKLGKLQQVPKVIKPRPVRLRPLCTTIRIDSNSNNIAVGGGGGGIAYLDPKTTVSVSNKTAKEVEAELELPGALPAVVSGSHNSRVHRVNDAYKAMVGQPVCPWLDILPAGAAGASRRINGRVVLDVGRFGPALRLPDAGPDAAFPCTARITWEQGGGSAIASLTVPCIVEHLTGRSGDYRFIWRFDSSRASIVYCIQ